MINPFRKKEGKTWTVHLDDGSSVCLSSGDTIELKNIILEGGSVSANFTDILENKKITVILSKITMIKED